MYTCGSLLGSFSVARARASSVACLGVVRAVLFFARGETRVRVFKLFACG
jgi:hypothetical protein